MKIINKICILINWSREIDMYETTISSLPKDKIEIVVNNIEGAEKERKGNSHQIEKILKDRNINYKYFSEIFKKEKYKVVISTGYASSTKVTILSFLKFIYGQSIGRFFDFLGISNLLTKLFHRPFNAGGKFSKMSLYAWYPEKIIGEKSIRYPAGTDLKLRYYPMPSLEKNFDIFFTHSLFEVNLIKKKFSNKTYKVLGYPRYENLKSYSQIKTEILNEFNLDKKKKIIYWTPTHIYFPGETLSNFLPWIEIISKLNDKYNIIVRPHPKSLNANKNILKILSKKNFFIDTKPDRKLGELFKVSDLALCDYGETIFSAIYLEKPVILLNTNKYTEFVKQQINNLSLDITLRKEIMNLNLEDANNEIKIFFSKASDIEYVNLIKKLKNNYFGDKKNYSTTEEIRNFILHLLN